jgi:rhodanese-related sulfurtransferase
MAAATLKKGIKQLIAEAEAKSRGISPEDAQEKLDDGNTVFVDLRDVRELERDGMIPGAFHAPRGMLEFWVDPDSPYHKPVFAGDKTFLIHCASGWRSLLATEVLQRMGLKPVLNMTGGFDAWKEANGPVEKVEPR